MSMDKFEYQHQLLEFNIDILLKESNRENRKDAFMNHLYYLMEHNEDNYLYFRKRYLKLNIHEVMTIEKYQEFELEMEQLICYFIRDYLLENMDMNDDEDYEDLEKQISQSVNKDTKEAQIILHLNEEQVFSFKELDIKTLLNKLNGQDEIDNYLDTFNEM